MRLTTPRLTLRPLELDDADRFVTLCQNKGFIEFNLGSYDSMDENKALWWISREIKKLSKFKCCKCGIFLKGSEELIGIAGIFNSPNRLVDLFEVNYRIVDTQRRNGYACEAVKALVEFAFESLKLSEIHATVDQENIPSKNLLKKMSFKYLEDITVFNVTLEHWICPKT